jgi:hypothetical protein
MAELAALADRVRSKNAGPLRITFDLFFDDRAAYERVRNADVLTASTIAERYRIAESDVLGIYTLDRISAIKISLRRPVPAGDIEDVDVYGTQQHGPLLHLEIPEQAD